MKYLKQQFQQFEWRSHEPADEREQALFNKAYRISYRSLVAIIIMSPGVFRYAYTTLETGYQALIASIIYVLLGFLLAEWIGGQVFANQDVVLSNRKLIRWYDKEEFTGISYVILFCAIFFFAIATYYLVTVPKI